jgi:hypothetical protein
VQVEQIARICEFAGVPHVINNAYGVQSAELCRRVSRAARCGRVDVIIQSTDKNFMVPVGGTVVASFKAGHQGARSLGQSNGGGGKGKGRSAGAVKGPNEEQISEYSAEGFLGNTNDSAVIRNPVGARSGDPAGGDLVGRDNDDMMLRDLCGNDGLEHGWRVLDIASSEIRCQRWPEGQAMSSRDSGRGEGRSVCEDVAGFGGARGAGLYGRLDVGTGGVVRQTAAELTDALEEEIVTGGVPRGSPGDMSGVMEGLNLELSIGQDAGGMGVANGATVAVDVAQRVARDTSEVNILKDMSQRYPGRASVAAHLDLAITLLYLGKSGWVRALRTREALVIYLKVCLVPI